MEVSALKFSGGIGLHGRSPLLRLQSDERLVALIRRGSQPAFEVLVARYDSRLLAFCRHMVGTREDAEDVLQEVMAAAYNALVADDRPVNLRPWLYRIARNRSLNHLRKTQAVGVDSMDIHFSDQGASTADKAEGREEFRLLVGDIQLLPETQRTALVLREMDALTYEQIAEAMETTVPSVKSLLVRARISLAEAAEARLLTCDEVRDELGEIAEGLKRKPSPAVRRHLKTCKRCDTFRVQLKETNKALAALLPLGPLVLIKKFALAQLGHHAGSGATAAGSGAGVAGGTAAGGALIGSGGFISAGLGAIATKAAAGLAAAALVTAGAVAVDHNDRSRRHHATPSATPYATATPTRPAIVAATPNPAALPAGTHSTRVKTARHAATHRRARHHRVAATTATTPTTTTAVTAPPVTTPPVTTPTTTTPPPGRTQTQTVPTVLPPSATTPTVSTPTSTTPTTSTPVAGTTPPSATTPSTTTTPAPTPETSTTSTSATAPAAPPAP
jgi:RNA polymerase sigma factor (sigma-70 family)